MAAPKKCPGCNHQARHHAKESRIVGCCWGRADSGFVVCGCRRIYHEAMTGHRTHGSSVDGRKCGDCKWKQKPSQSDEVPGL